MKEVVLFDLGNVLAKPIDDYELYNKLNCKISYEQFLKYWWYDDLAIKAHEGLISDEEHIKALLSFCNSDLSVDDFYQIYNSLDNSLYDDTVDCIKLLKAKGYKVGILSNLRLMDFNRYSKQIEQIGFDYLFLSYKLNKLKPSKEIYLHVINILECKPNELIFFDDKLENVDVAKSVGIDAYQVTGNTINGFLGKFSYDSLDEVNIF